MHGSSVAGFLVLQAALLGSLEILLPDAIGAAFLGHLGSEGIWDQKFAQVELDVVLAKLFCGHRFEPNEKRGFA